MGNARRVAIMGAGGREFHNFNVFFRDHDDCEVVAFTAAQVPGIENRVYPPILAGPRYPTGIPIEAEGELPRIIRERHVDDVMFAYSDISYADVMVKASLVLSEGADFKLLAPKRVMLKTRLPLVSVCATRTGAGKTTVVRKVCHMLKSRGLRTTVIRHPMAYGDLSKRVWQRFSSPIDLNYDCTFEESEEIMPHLAEGTIVYAGVDYGEILRRAERESDVLVWDGGNNDLPFYETSFHIVVADCLRPGHELTYYPSDLNVRLADVVVLSKVDLATPEAISAVERNVKRINTRAVMVHASLFITVDNPNAVQGKRVVVVEDGPSITHGGMPYGAGFLAAKKNNAGTIVDPRPHAAGALAAVYVAYPHIGPVIPTVGYTEAQRDSLKETLNRMDFDTLMLGSPIDVSTLVREEKPVVKVSYEMDETSAANMGSAMAPFIGSLKPT
ncbi:MAG: GTPase [Candidatus Bathyarchaeia archaeon]